MAALDILILLIFIVSIVYGLRRGVITQLGSVGGVIVGIIACRLFSGSVTRLFAGSNPDANDLYVSGVFASVLLFIVGFIAARLVAGLIKTVTHSLHLTVIDRVVPDIQSAAQHLAGIPTRHRHHFQQPSRRRPRGQGRGRLRPQSAWQRDIQGFCDCGGQRRQGRRPQS